jgi:hypothetical protein
MINLLLKHFNFVPFTNHQSGKERYRKKDEKRIQEDTDKPGMVYIGLEREESKEKFLEEGEKRRRTDEKRCKEKVNKKVDGQRKRKTEKKHKGDSRHRKSRNGKVKGQKEKRKRDKLPGE